MTQHRSLSNLALAVIALVIPLGAWAWYLMPGFALLYFCSMSALPAIWLTLRLQSSADEERQRHKPAWRRDRGDDGRLAMRSAAVPIGLGSIVVIGLMFVICAAGLIAHHFQLLGQTATTVIVGRGSNVALGLAAAVLGNLLPKTLIPSGPSPAGDMAAQAYKRFSGWCFVLGGLAYAGVWAFVAFPFPAVWIGISILMAAALLPVIYKAWLSLKVRRAAR